jgi:hypothetical protein
MTDEELDRVADRTEKLLNRAFSGKPPSALQIAIERLDLEEDKMIQLDKVRHSEYQKLHKRFTTGRRAAVIASRLKYAQEERQQGKNHDQKGAD